MYFAFSIAAFFGLLCAIIFAQARLCGWNGLPNESHKLVETESERWRFSSIAISLNKGIYIGLRSACGVVVGRAGISLRPHFPALIGFRNVSLPWDSVSSYAQISDREPRVILHVMDYKYRIVFLGKPAEAIIKTLRSRGTPIFSGSI